MIYSNFLKNCSVKGKRCVQNTRKHTIDKLHHETYEILCKVPE